MRTNKSFIFKVFALFCLSAVLLASCGTATESPDQVIQNFKQQITEIKSGDVSAEVSMEGTDGADVINFTSDMNFKFDRRDAESGIADVKIALGGVMKTADELIEGDIDISLKSVDDNYYVKLDKLDSNNENMKKLAPVIKKYIGVWHHISNDFIPENVRKFQEKDEATLLREKQLKDLFVTTNIFTVTKEYGIESVMGNKAYHYGIKFNDEGVQEYIRKTAIIDGRELTDTEIQDASKMISYIQNAELWIGVKDYYPYKAAFSLSGIITKENANMGMNIVINGSDYNKALKIEAPKDAAELNPLEIIMALSVAGGSFSETGEDVILDDETIPTEEVTEEVADEVPTEEIAE